MSTLGFKATHLHASLPVCNRFLRFTCGMTPADLLAASMAGEPLHPHTCVQALVMLQSRIKCAAASQYVTRHTLYRLSYTGSVSFWIFISLSYNILDSIHVHHNIVLIEFSLNSIKGHWPRANIVQSISTVTFSGQVLCKHFYFVVGLCRSSDINDIQKIATYFIYLFFNFWRT